MVFRPSFHRRRSNAFAAAPSSFLPPGAFAAARALLLGGCVALAVASTAQAATEDFEDDTLAGFDPTMTVDDFTFYSGGVDGFVADGHPTFTRSPLAGKFVDVYAHSQTIYFRTSNAANTMTVTSMSIGVTLTYTSGNFTVEGLTGGPSGTLVASDTVNLESSDSSGSVSYTFSSSGSTGGLDIAAGTMTFSSAWANVDTIKFTSIESQPELFFDNIDYTLGSGNATPTDISLSASSVNQSSGVNATVGTLSTTDADGGDTHTYSLVSGTGDTNNASFNISGSMLRANNAATLAGGTYAVRVRTTDSGSTTYEEAFSISVVDDIVPTITSIVRQTPSAQVMRTSSVVFAVTFSEAVTNVGTSSFVVVPINGGTTTATVVSVTGGPVVYDVTANITGGAGDFRLDVGPAAATFATGFSNPTALAFDSAGNLYAAENGNNTVRKVTSGGVVSTFATGFAGPYGLAFSAAGDLYVSSNSQVKKVTSGGVVSTFASGFSVAGGLAFDGAGNLYVGNYGNNTISKVTSGGVVSTFATGVNAPLGLTFDADGDLYVASRDANTISKVTSGGVVSTFATGFAGPHEIEFDSVGDLYVADRWASRVARVTSDGTVSTYATSLGAPYGLAFDAEGALYVSSYVGNTVNKLTLPVIDDLAGNPVPALPYTSGEVYTYDPNDAPTDIQLSNASVFEPVGAGAMIGTLSSTDADSADTHTYSLINGTDDTDNGSFAIDGSSLRAGASPVAAGYYSVRVQANDGQGGTYAEAFIIAVGVPRITSIVRKTPTTQLIGTNTVAFEVTFSEAVTAVTTGGFAVTPINGSTVTGTVTSVSGGPTTYDVVVSVTGGAGEFRLDAVVQTPIASTFASGFNSPSALAFDSAGNLFVANSGDDTVSKVTSDGDLSLFASGFNSPAGLAFDDVGNLYVANRWNSTVSSVTSDGSVSVFASGFNEPIGLAFDSAGNLYVSTGENNSVSKVTSDADVSSFANGFNGPTGMAFDGAGNLYVGNRWNNSVSKVTSDGTGNFYTDGFNGAEGLAFDSAGTLYVANNWNNTVSKVTRSKVVSTFAADINQPTGLAFDSAGNLFVASSAGAITRLVSVSIKDLTGIELDGLPYSSGETYTAPTNAAPTDISLSKSSVNQSGGANATVGTLTTTDADGGDTHTYSLASGTGDTNNSSFNLSGSTLRVNNASALSAGSYAVRIRTTDAFSATYEEAFTITVEDDVAPTVSSVSVPANSTYVAGQNLDFTVNWTEAVTVNGVGGTPRIGLTIGASSTQAGYISGSGTATLVFRHTVAAGSLDSDGVAVAGSISANGGTLKDAEANDATLTLNSVGSTIAVLVDGVVPSVTSINRQTPSGATTSATSLVYRVTFSESVSGVGVADFSLTSTGTASGTIHSVSAGSGTTVDVTTVNAAGDGTLRLDLNASGTGITDAATNGIGGGFTGGQTYTIDNTQPAAPSVSAITTDTGSSATDEITSDTTLVISGTAEANSTVTVSRDSVILGTATADGGGDWSYDYTGTTLTVGTYVFTATAADAASNASAASAPLSVTIDTAAPAAPAITMITNDTGASSTDQITSDTTLVFSGTAEAQATVTVYRNAAPIGTTTADGNGEWSFDYTAATLAEGAHTFTATATDAAGNTSSESTAFLVEIDVSTPSTPTITSLTNDTGVSSTDGITNDATLVLTGTADANAVITVSRSGGGTIGATTADGSGAWTFDYTGTTLGDGDYLFTAFATDTAGNNSSVSADFPVTIDTTATGAPSSFTATATGSTIALAWINPIAGDFTSCTIRRSSSAFPTSVVDGTAVAAGQTGTSFSQTSLTDGTFYYAIFAADLAGNVSVAATASGTVDTTAPVVTSAGSASGTYDEPFTFSVTATGEAVSYGASNLPGGLSIAAGSGAISGTPTAAGIFNATVTATDAAHNVASASLGITIAKADQTVTFASVGPVTVGSVVTLSATASSDLPVTYSVINGNGTISGSSFTANDANAIAVRATQAGNAEYHLASTDQTIASYNITRLSQIITFAQPDVCMTSDAAFSLSATASSGLTVNFTVQSGPATVSGSTVTLTGAPGIVTVGASQTGNAAYAAAPDVTCSFAVISPAPSTCFGSVTSGSQDHGSFAAHFAADGLSGVLMGYLPGVGAFVLNVTPDANGAFVATTTALTSDAGQLPAGMAAAPVTWTFRGQIQGGTLSGSIDEPGHAFAGVFDPVTGPTATIAGFYITPSLGTSTGLIYSMLGTRGTIFVLAVLPDLVAGDTGTIDGTTGDFVITVEGGVMIDGHASAVNGTVDGAVIRNGGATTDFAGLVIGAARTDRLINLSSRARVGAGENIIITGFVIGGTEPKEILLRAVGPGLVDYHVSGTLADPRLTLIHAGVVLATNDDWGSASNGIANADAVTVTGAFSLEPSSKDAAMLITLQPGSYTAIIDSAGGASGVALAEVYDASSNVTPAHQRLLNISTRGHVGPGDDALIGGFVVTGNAPKRVLVRGVGPKLTAFGVTGVLADPSLVIFQGSSAIAQNDDWGAGANTITELAAAATATGAFALDSGSKDAAILITLAPGLYTTHVTGVEGATGTALVEVYEVP